MFCLVLFFLEMMNKDFSPLHSLTHCFPGFTHSCYLWAILRMQYAKSTSISSAKLLVNLLWNTAPPGNESCSKNRNELTTGKETRPEGK